MKKTIGVLFTLALMCVSTLALCDTPEEAVKGMMEAVKAGDYEKAAGYVDIAGIARTLREFMESVMETMPDESKVEMKKEMEKMSPENIKAQMIAAMKAETTGENFSYKIIETKDKTENTAVVVVEITVDDETKTEEIPLIKVDGKWKIGMSKKQMMGEPQPDVEAEEEQAEEKETEEKE